LPGHQVHNYFDREIFGKSYPKIHRQMDVAVFWLGKSHRRLYHDFPTAFCIGKSCYPNDTRAEESAIMHIILDKLCTDNPAWKMLLEQLAYSDAKRRKKDREQKKKRRGRQQPSRLREEAIIRQLLESMKFYRSMARC
jgi:hypothetical protein